MQKIISINNPQYVQKQYQNASKLNARIRLHQEFSTNPYGWNPWVFDHFEFPAQGKILELGCGAGNLWLENEKRIPSSLETVLSDFSEGMLQQTRENLKNTRGHFQFKACDVQSIPFNDHEFDLVIANHMLYHVPDRNKAFTEIHRVLKLGGRFYTSTNGKNHLIELEKLPKSNDPQLSGWNKLFAEAFSLENGSSQLEKYFTNIVMDRYPDSLLITDANLLADYILSSRVDIPSGQKDSFAEFIKCTLDNNGGKLQVTKDVGIFMMRKN